MGGYLEGDGRQVDACEHQPGDEGQGSGQTVGRGEKEPQGGDAFDEHRRTDDEGDEAGVGRLVRNETVLADPGEQWVVDDLDDPDQPDEKPGRRSVDKGDGHLFMVDRIVERQTTSMCTHVSWNAAGVEPDRRNVSLRSLLDRPTHDAGSMRRNASPSPTPPVRPWVRASRSVRSRNAAAWVPSSSAAITIVVSNWLS